ncbi:MAG: flagellar basal body P-ring protein FlgI [Acidobacteriota bacterium]
MGALRMAGRAAAAAVALLLLGSAAAGADEGAVKVRLKDLGRIQGVRSNPLVGYGVVIGLAGTGDGTQATFTTQSVANLLRRMGVFIDPDDIRLRNTGAVVVTADLPPFAETGSRIDVTVSSLGDAKSLQGGTLLMTALKGSDGKVYAVAQGPVSIGGAFLGGSGGTSVTKNHVTAGRIPGGGVVERSVALDLATLPLKLILDQPDPTTAQRMVNALNASFGEGAAAALSPGSISLKRPDSGESLTAWLARVEEVEIAPDLPARVVFNEKTGTVVLGSHLRISPVAVAHGNLSVEIQTDPVISQPAPFSPGGQTISTSVTDVATAEEEARLIPVKGGVSLGDLIRSLNALGVSSRDLIAILQAIKAAGALHADLVIL